jgi:heme/copper-type cytochrome/quinol oxidase subunit 3
MRNKQLTLFIAVGAIVFFGALIYNTMSYSQHRVEACMEFEGRKNCRIAQGATKEAALRMAIENACALIASGMTQSMACTSTPPKSVRWIER